MQRALPLPPAYDDSVAPSALTGILAHLDAVYGFALTLTGDAAQAEALTEDVFESVHDELWSTLGGHGLRDRLLARCATTYSQTLSPRNLDGRTTQPPSDGRGDGLTVLLLGLPWNERAAIALVDQLGLTHAAAAAVLGNTVSEFHTLLRRGRCVLFAAYRGGAR